eukprot:s4106_g2.t3
MFGHREVVQGLPSRSAYSLGNKLSNDQCAWMCKSSKDNMHTALSKVQILYRKHKLALAWTEVAHKISTKFRCQIVEADTARTSCRKQDGVTTHLGRTMVVKARGSKEWTVSALKSTTTHGRRGCPPEKAAEVQSTCVLAVDGAPAWGKAAESLGLGTLKGYTSNPSSTPPGSADPGLSIASLSFVGRPLLTTPGGAAVQQGWESSPPSLSNAAWAPGVLLAHGTVAATVACEVGLMRANEPESQGVSMAARAFASPGVRSEPLMDALAEAAIKLHDELKPQNVANTTWGPTTASIFSEPPASAPACKIVVTFSFVLLVIIVTYPSVVASVADARRMVQELDGQEIANTADLDFFCILHCNESSGEGGWRMAQALAWHGSLSEALAGEAISKVAERSPQSRSNTMRALTKTSVSVKPPLTAAVSAAVSTGLSRHSRQDTSSALWSCAALAMPGTALVNAARSFGRCHLVEFAGSELANVVWAFATVAVHDSSLLESVAIRGALSLAEFEWQSPANVYHIQRSTSVACYSGIHAQVGQENERRSGDMQMHLNSNRNDILNCALRKNILHLFLMDHAAEFGVYRQM